MDTYLCMLYVSLEQEKALKKFFLDNGWKYRKPDPAHYTDQIGPIDLEISQIDESHSPSIKLKSANKKRPVQSISTKTTRKKQKVKSNENEDDSPSEVMNVKDEEIEHIVDNNDDDGDDDDDFVDDDAPQQDVSDNQHVSKLDGTVEDNSYQTSCYGNDDDLTDDNDDELIGSSIDVKNEVSLLDKKSLRFQCGKCLHYFSVRKQLTEHLIADLCMDENIVAIDKDSFNVTLKEVISVVKKEDDDADDYSKMIHGDADNENCVETLSPTSNKSDAENVADVLNDNTKTALSENENLDMAFTENEINATDEKVCLQMKQAELMDKTYICNLCHFSFGSDYLLKLHYHDKHGGEKEDTMMLTCDECPMVLRGTGFYISHKKKVHNVIVSFQQQLFPCEICQQLFTRKDTLKDHVDTVHFKKKRRLRKKPTEKKFVCDTCGALFLHKGHLNEHIGWKHDGTGKRHVCVDCGKEFLRPSSLEYHRNKAHLKSTPYKCEACDKEYHTMRSLRRHQEICLMDDEKKIHCDLCGKKFSTSYNYNMHMDAIHNEKPCVCECGAVIKWKSSMTKHKRRCVLSGAKKKPSQSQRQSKLNKDKVKPIKMRKDKTDLDSGEAYVVESMDIDADNASYITIPADTDEIAVDTVVSNALKEGKLLTKDQISDTLQVDSSNVTIRDDGTAQSVYYVILKE